MHIPNNEGKACDAAVRFLEKHTGETRADIHRPEIDGVGPLVELRLRLGVQEYAVEHTRIESFENQIKAGVIFKKINSYIKQNLSDALPGRSYYELHVPTDICLPRKKRKCDQALKNLVEWIQTSAQCLYKRNANRFKPAWNPYQSDDRIRGAPAGINCSIELLRWPNANLIRRKPGGLEMKFICPSNLDSLLFDRLMRALSGKCPKLESCKAEGARTVLVLENLDIVLTSFDLIGNRLSALLAKCTDAPDEIYLVETHSNPWWVWLMKRDNNCWPTGGMPPQDQLFTPHSPGWGPLTLDKDELEDLILGETRQVF